jgi:magnesium chelatase subunit D
MQRFASETALLTQRIAQARSRLPQIDATLDERRRLSAEAVRLGVEGNRADIFALRAACAHAALLGRTSLHEDDLRIAVRLVLLPRAGLVEQARISGADPLVRAGSPDPAGPTRGSAADQGVRPTWEDAVIHAIDCAVTQDILTPPRRSEPRGPRRRSGRRARDSSKETRWDRGRCVRAVGARPHASRIAVAATLRAAAVSKAQQPPIRITAGDLRFKQFKQIRGMLIIFAVDASGSMAVNRIHQAKGAIIRLLGKAYLHRDEVALVAFRGTRAEVLLPPTRSVELARRALEALPVGGGTPLAAGLAAALDLARNARLVAREKLLVLVTDGRANAGSGSREAVWPEIEQVCAALQSELVNSVVIDTTNPVISSGEAGRVAELLGGRLVCLPRPDADAVCEAVAAATGRSR